MLWHGIVTMNHMKKCIALFLCALFLLSTLTFTACTAENDPKGTETEAETLTQTTLGTASEPTPDTPETTPPPAIPEHQTVTVYVPKSLAATVTLETLANRFMTENLDVTVEIQSFDQSPVDYANMLASDLLSGKGPDLLLVGFEELTRNTMSLLETDAFADLNSLNATWGYLDFTEYEAVADALVWDGQRKALPLCYNVPLLLGIQEDLKDAGVKYDTTFSDFAASLGNYDGIVFRSPVLPASMYLQTGLNAIDERGDKVDFTAAPFPAFVDAYQSMYPVIYAGGYSSYVVKGQYEYDFGSLLAGDVLFYNRASALGINSIGFPYDTIVGAGKTPVITTMPAADGGAPAIIPGLCAGINAASDNQEAVLRFLDYLTGFEAGYDLSGHGISVNKAYNAALRAVAYGEEYTLPEGFDESKIGWHNIAYPMSREFLDSYYALLDAAEVKTLVDQDALDYVGNVIADIQKSGMSASEAIAKENSALQIYLYE